DLNDIDAALDCDISTLDAYLHSIPCSNTNTTEFTVPEPSFKSVAYCSSHERFSSSDADPVEEFFPDLSKTFAVPCTNSSSRRRSHSSGIDQSSVPCYSPPSSNSTALASREYRLRRDKNNLASQRSRQKRAEKVREMRIERDLLERRNIELKTLLSSLELQGGRL
ncbi:basic region leucine zipper, partial [Ostertagia ostertagi]